jgi:energy-coupling factor transporter ATP-binding protein EcfA2
MLDVAFYESRAYRELVGGKDYRFVVGRRGTGKSALARKVRDALTRQKGVLLLSEHPEEEKVSAWHSELGGITGNYAEARTIAKLAWKVQVLTQALDTIVDNYKYDVRQFIIEAKNFEIVDATEFRQAWGYLKGPYGRCLMMVTRSQQDHGVTERERDLIKEGYDFYPNKLVVLMPARVLSRALQKMRSKKENRDDYIIDMLEKRLDAYERDYVHLKTTRSKKRRTSQKGSA